MRSMRSTLALLAVVALCTVDAACPPAGFDSVGNLNVTAFIAQPWYAQQQASEGLCGWNSASKG